MIVLSKLFTAFVLPPGCIIAALALIVIFVPRRYKIAPVVVLALLYALSIRPVSDFLLYPLEAACPPFAAAQAKDAEAIVVLGGGTIQGSPEAGAGHDTLSADAVKRVVYAFTLRDAFFTHNAQIPSGPQMPYVFSGGKVFDYNQEPEAETAGRLFAALGLEPGRVFLESQSRNTWENARETAKLGYRQVILVTSAYHMRRSVFCFEGNGMTVIPAPTDYKCERGRNHDFLSLLPSMQYLYQSYLALHEYIGLLSYRLLYRG